MCPASNLISTLPKNLDSPGAANHEDQTDEDNK
jgi:hypothetical protein